VPAFSDGRNPCAPGHALRLFGLEIQDHRVFEATAHPLR
jgi:hypothetical protein